MFAEYFKVWMAGLGCALSYFYGGWSTTLIILCYFIVIDFVLGTMVAMKEGELSPKKSFDGANKKLVVMIAVGIGHLLDQGLNTNFIMNGTIFYYLSGELVSIGKNAALMGVPLPDIVLKAMEKTKDGGTVGQ